MRFDFSSSVILIAILSALLGAWLGKIDRDKALENQSKAYYFTHKHYQSDKIDL